MKRRSIDNDARPSSPRERGTFTAPAMFLGLALLLVLAPAYIGGYYWALSDIKTLPVDRDGMLLNGGALRPTYRIGGSFAEQFFTLAHWVDCQFRPDQWWFDWGISHNPPDGPSRTYIIEEAQPLK